MSDARPTYRFKWSNVNLEDFVKQRKFTSQQLRRQAEVLIKRAEQIDNETTDWELALEEVTDADQENAK